MKKSILLILLVASLMLPSCGRKADLTVMMWGDPVELEIWNQIVDDFNAIRPDLKIDVEVADWDSYWTKLKTLLAAGTPPDIFAIDAPYYLDYQTRDVLLNLQPYIDASPGLLDGLYPQTLEAYQTADGYFGLPRDFQTIVMFYNKDMFDAAGVPYPQQGWTYDDFRTIAEQLTLDKNGDGVTDQFGFSTDTYDMETGWSEVLWSYGAEIISADHKQTLIGTPEARQGWQLLYDMMFVDGSMPDTNTAEQYGDDLFLAGMTAMTPIGHWTVPTYVDAGLNFDVAPMPTGPAGQFTSVNSAGFVIAKTCPNPDNAWEFLKYILGTEAQTSLTSSGFAVPVLNAVAESPTFLEQAGDINQQVFLDSIEFARIKPIFVGYDEWSAAVGDNLGYVWAGEAELDPTLDAAVIAADEVLAQY